jgi:hypothetical protein
MKKHILIENTFVYPEPNSVSMPENYDYNFQKGYWMEADTGIPMMQSNSPRTPQTKKADIETGEDQKGE